MVRHHECPNRVFCFRYPKCTRNPLHKRLVRPPPIPLLVAFLVNKLQVLSLPPNARFPLLRQHRAPLQRVPDPGLKRRLQRNTLQRILSHPHIYEFRSCLWDFVWWDCECECAYWAVSNILGEGMWEGNEKGGLMWNKYNGKTIWRQFRLAKNQEHDIRMWLMKKYKDAPDWYLPAPQLPFSSLLSLHPLPIIPLTVIQVVSPPLHSRARGHPL